MPHLRCCVELSASALVVDVPCLGDPRFAEFARRIEDGIKELTRITRY